MIGGTALLGVVLVGAMIARRAGAVALRREAPWLAAIVFLFAALVLARRFLEQVTGADLITPLLVVTALVLLVGRSRNADPTAEDGVDEQPFRGRSFWWLMAGLLGGSAVLTGAAVLLFGR